MDVRDVALHIFKEVPECQVLENNMMSVVQSETCRTGLEVRMRAFTLQRTGACAVATVILEFELLFLFPLRIPER